VSVDDSDDDQLEVELTSPGKGEAQYYNTTVASRDVMLLHVVNASSSPHAITIEVSMTNNATDALDIYIKVGSKPTKTEYDVKGHISKQADLSNNSEIYSMFLSTHNLTDGTPDIAADLYVGITFTGTWSFTCNFLTGGNLTGNIGGWCRYADGGSQQVRLNGTCIGT
jgi:hypothetical protein